MKWKEVLAEPYSLPLDTVTSVVYEIGEDTLVDNRLCKTIMMNGERLERWIFEEDDRVWILTKDFPDPIMIYDFNWNNESPFCEYLRVNEPSQEVELLKSYLNKDDIKNVIYKNQSIEYILNDDGGMIRHIGRVSDLRRNSCLLGYKIVEPVLPGIEYLKVLWIVRGPPRPEAILYGMMQLQRKVKVEKFLGGANHKQTREERELGLSNEAITYGWKKPIVVTDVPEDFVEQLKNNQEDAK